MKSPIDANRTLSLATLKVGSSVPSAPSKLAASILSRLVAAFRAVLEHLLGGGALARSRYAALCSVGLTTASRHLGELAARGLLVQVGNGSRRDQPKSQSAKFCARTARTYSLVNPG